MARIDDGDHDPHHGEDPGRTPDQSHDSGGAQPQGEIPADELWAAARAIHGEHQPEDQQPNQSPEHRTETTDTWILQSLAGHSHLHEYDHEEIRRPGWRPLPSPPPPSSASRHDPGGQDAGVGDGHGTAHMYDSEHRYEVEHMYEPEPSLETEKSDELEHSDDVLHDHELEQISATVEIPEATEPDDDDEDALPSRSPRRRGGPRRSSPLHSSSRRGSSRGLIIGQPPHATLLPPELAEAKKARGYRGYAIVLVVLVIGAMVGLTYLAWRDAETENSQRIAAEERGEQLLQAQDEFLEARQLADQVDAIEAAAEAATWTHIDWHGFLAELDRTLPDEVSITELEIEAASPLVGFPQLDEPVASSQDRAGIAILTAQSPEMPPVATWLRGLEEIPGFLDATVDQILEGDNDAGEEDYSVTITMRLDEDVFSTPEVAE